MIANLRAIIIADARDVNVQAALNESAFKIVIPRAIKRICKLQYRLNVTLAQRSDIVRKIKHDYIKSIFLVTCLHIRML